MALMDKTNRAVLTGAGLGLLALLFWSYCGRVDGGQAPAVAQSPPVIEPEPVVEEPVIPVVAPVVVLADEPVPLPPVAAAPPSLETVPPELETESKAEPVAAVVAVASVATVPVVASAKPAVVQSPSPPPVSAPPLAEPVPEQDLLIASAASRRFTPDVAALASAGLSVGIPIQGDENALNVLQPCDTPASACGAGVDPAQVIGGVNDWTGFVLPGF